METLPDPESCSPTVPEGGDFFFSSEILLPDTFLKINFILIQLSRLNQRDVLSDGPQARRSGIIWV